MGKDITNLHLTSAASDVVNRLRETGYFDTEITVTKFALGYALKNHSENIDPATYKLADSNGSNFHVGSIDGDGQVAALLRALYETDTPYLYARALMVYGSIKIGERIDAEGLTSISAFM
jgi:hypothetical protein